MRFWICILALTFVGCDAKRDESPAAVPRDVPGSATIRGIVKFAGKEPEVKMIPNQPCHEGAQPIPEETVVVNNNGTLRNVFVYLEGAPKLDGGEREPAVLDQVNCRYVPHVLGVQIRQPVRIRSSDPILHNVHYMPQQNEARNFGLTSAGDEKQVSFEDAEFVRVKCDVHPWMTAYIGVFDNPFFATTGDDGSFEIGNVPAGEYTLVAWHEQYGVLEQPVTLKDGQAIETEFEYKSP